MRVAIYIRVSTLDQAREGYSLAAQRAALEHWAADRRHEIVRVYEDAGISAKDIKHRPAMRRLLWAAKREQYDILLVWALSRLTRSVMDLYSTAELLRQHKIALVSYTEAIDTSTPTGRAMMGMLGVFAQMEREVTVERVRAAMAERAAQGKRTCNCVLGYDLVGKDALSVNEREAEHVRFIYAAYLECGSLYGTVKRARAAGIRGKLGGQMSAESVKKILTRPIYIGYNTRLGEMIPGAHEPIIEREAWERVQVMLKGKDFDINRAGRAFCER